MRFITRGFR